MIIPRQQSMGYVCSQDSERIILISQSPATFWIMLDLLPGEYLELTAQPI